MIAAADLPPLFIEEHLEGFIAAERTGDLVACGGIEVYGDCAVIRSVVVGPSARGLGLGGELATRLLALGWERGARDVYLFTGDALPFWTRYGFAEVTFDDWKDAARASWQYQFLSQNREAVSGIHTMWRSAQP